MKKLVPSLLLSSISLLANNAQAEFASVGLPDPVHKFPVSITDTNNVSLTLCRDGDGVTGMCIFDPIDPTSAWSVTTGFGAEAFFNLANATLTMPSGRRGLLVLGTEAAYLPATVADGNQNLFGRIRIRVDVPGPGTYRVFHPYMKFPGCQPNVYTVNGGRRAINDTLDIGGGAPFSAVLAGQVGPFLQWDPKVAPLAPPGYVGNPQVPHAITGSKCGTNVFRVDGPNIGGVGVNTVSTNLFNVSGKIYVASATESPLVIDRATFDRTVTTTGTTARLNVFAQAAPTATVTMSAIPGLAAATVLSSDGAGNFFAQVSAVNATPPTSVTLSATSPTPGVQATQATATVTDSVDVLPSVYISTTTPKQLTISATSSEKAVPPALTATVGKTPVALTRNATTGVYSATVSVVTPPKSVTVVSSKGGKDVENIKD